MRTASFFYVSENQFRCTPSNSAGVCLQNIYDYSSFGVSLDGRTLESDFYRRGFNGMEKDDEFKGKGNSYTTEFRQYDPRIGRWLSLDPLMTKSPGMSPYASFNNNPLYFSDPTGLEGQDNIHIYEDGAMYVEKTDDATNTYYFHHCDGSEVVIGDQLKKTGTGMVKMPQNTDSYEQVANKDRKYLPEDAAAGFLAATYMYNWDNCRKVKINQFMTSDWTHSSKPTSKACIDVQYIGDENTPWGVQPQSNHHNVDVDESNELANRYREYGFNTDGAWSIISLDGDFKGPLLDYSAPLAQHHHHFHVQGWSPPDGSFKPIIGKVNSSIVKGQAIMKPLTETMGLNMTKGEQTTYIYNRVNQVGLEGLNCWEWGRGQSLGIWQRLGVDTMQSSGCGKNQ